MKSDVTKKFGFTLIELLVVIAIIGILAAVVLTRMNDARIQGIEAKMLLEIDALVKEAALQETVSLSYDPVCGSNSVPQSPKIAEIIASINFLASSTAVCNSDTGAYAVSVPLGSEHWCVDSIANKKTIPTELTTELACP